MSTVQVVTRTVHLLVGSLWVGAVAFVALGVLPVARDGDANAAPVERVVGRLTTLSRASALATVATGGYLVATRYAPATLTGTTRGRVAVAGVVLWVLFAGLVEVGSARLVDGLRAKRVRAPAREGLRWYGVASVVGLSALAVAGLVTLA